ncbi:response regulator transcription factor [Clostridium beijerinckii]|jgi:Response regulators consisting of a CheY-like receiver domain and a winged-helix DNA-binding domain|uniref:Stage 0 sporulation protein A homolog n=2 Tax=Clostridium beijerinckii TaxID=1520 RepID=A0AAE2UVP4_CLOBE|nr:winged helix-turn-helix domain-containing protein [Clostridium beijerinckii]ABR36213.1 two component transcriptional regulator, winged helix family [Clostridium beijerinckii NCIMB 8052]AIU03723.1 two component transcriptional regulator [Clostridium beijerinckii ATCC 35702]MBF7809139.1 response regulator transcription factor [Clostridium beijerinckii]NOW89634.1 DNA-binding response OmpR family regulator [Clostridium beijerinckii]NRT22728.1 DNA-binding response OmpR family regulator [Clostrid
MDIKILIAEDDNIFRDLVCDIVRKEGYMPIEACDGEEAINMFFNNNDIDLVILDVMMPVYDGWEVLKEIREKSEVPIIMLTALGDEKHEVLGLKKGADDYIGKPFSYEIFVARLNNIVKKVKKKFSDEIAVGNLRIYQRTHKVVIDDEEIKLNPKEYNLLLYLVGNINTVLSREQILDKVWGYNFDGDIRTIDTHIKTLRAKLSEQGDWIKTIRGSGYMFEVEKYENN